MKETPNNITSSEIDTDIRRFEVILGTGILTGPLEPRGNPLMESAFIEIMILLRDLMWKCKKYASRIDFIGGIHVTEYIGDVTDLITYIRDAACHIDSPKRNVPDSGIRISFTRTYGKCFLLEYGNTEIVSAYDDDVGFVYGGQKIYLNHHILEAFIQAKKQLLPLLWRNNT